MNKIDLFRRLIFFGFPKRRIPVEMEFNNRKLEVSFRFQFELSFYQIQDIEVDGPSDSNRQV